MKRNLIIALLLLSYIVACAKPAKVTITAPKATPEVSPSAQKTVTQTGKTVDAIDATSIHANAVNDLDPAKKPLITGLTNARAEAVRAVEQATETHTLAVAKDAEAKAAQGALVEAIRAVKELAASEAKARGERDKLQEKLDDYRKNIITWTLRGMLVLCGLASLAGIYLLYKMDWWNGGALLGTGATGGALFIFGIRFQTEIAIAVACAIGLAVLVFAYLAYRRLHEGSASIVKGFQAAIAAGKVDLSEVAGIFDSIQTKFGKTLVDQNTKHAKQPAPDIDGPGNVAVGGNA